MMYNRSTLESTVIGCFRQDHMDDDDDDYDEDDNHLESHYMQL